jgi:hypothetical protein
MKASDWCKIQALRGASYCLRVDKPPCGLVPVTDRITFDLTQKRRPLDGFLPSLIWITENDMDFKNIGKACEEYEGE